MFDVGQGAANLLDFGDGVMGIVDCGLDDAGQNPLYKHLKSLNEEEKVHRIVFTVMSHLDFDHVAGFADVLNDASLRSKIESVYCNDLEFRLLFELLARGLSRQSGVKKNPRFFKSLLVLRDIWRSAKEGGLPLHEIRAPFPNTQDLYPAQIAEDLLPLQIEVLAPLAEDPLPAAKRLSNLLDLGDTTFEVVRTLSSYRADWNSSSVVLRVGCPDSGYALLPGDATQTTLRRIRERLPEEGLNVDFAVAWHHGARLGRPGDGSVDRDMWSFVKGGRPRLEVGISCGCENRYGHPHQETLLGIREVGGQFYCTQSQGCRLGKGRPPQLSDLDFEPGAVGRLERDWRPTSSEAGLGAVVGEFSSEHPVRVKRTLLEGPCQCYRVEGSGIS